MTDNTEFRELLDKRIKEAKTSRSALGRVVGVHRTTISDYIAGKYLPTEETFHRIHQVFPDKELYEAYFKAVGKPVTENKPKCMISDAKPYNYYKAQVDDIKAEDASKNSEKPKEVIEDENAYIRRALKFTIEYLLQMKADQLVPKEYELYKKLLEKYSRGA